MLFYLLNSASTKMVNVGTRTTSAMQSHKLIKISSFQCSTRLLNIKNEKPHKLFHLWYIIIPHQLKISCLLNRFFLLFFDKNFPPYWKVSVKQQILRTHESIPEGYWYPSTGREWSFIQSDCWLYLLILPTEEYRNVPFST